MRSQATQKVAELRGALAERNSPVEVMQSRIDALQQTLLSIGESVYLQAQQPQTENYGTTQSAPWQNGHLAAESNPFEEYSEEEFTDDETITADYEAVD